MSRIKRYRLFNIFQYDQEEQFLNDMHQQGYAFVKYVAPYTYYFEAVTPATVTYKLEYKNIVEDKDTYLQLMADYGWEYIDTYLDYFYLRQSGQQTVPTFYSDHESALNHLNRIMRNRFIPILIAIVILILINLGDQPQTTLTRVVFYAVNTVTATALLICAWVTFHYFRLRARITEGDAHDN